MNRIPKAIPIIPIVILFIIGVGVLSGNVYITNVEEYLQKNYNQYFDSERLGLIANGALILIGVYATITSVFGSSTSMATSRLSEKDLSDDFLKIVISAIMSALLLSFYIILGDPINFVLLICMIIYMIYGFVRFLIVILLMYHYNVRTTKVSKQQEEEKYEKLMDILTEINILLKKERGEK